MGNFDVYCIYNNNEDHLMNVAVTGDITDLLRWTRDNRYRSEFLDSFNMDLERDAEDIEVEGVMRVVKQTMI